MFIERVEDVGKSSGIIYLMTWGANSGHWEKLPKRAETDNFIITEYEENYYFTNSSK